MPTLEDANSLLGVVQGADASTLRAAYVRAVKAHSPNVLVGQRRLRWSIPHANGWCR